jgi:dCMP deaminase
MVLNVKVCNISMNTLVCLVGMTGSGKSVAADEFVQRGFLFVRFGQITIDIIKEKGLEPTEENEKEIRESVRKEQGMGAFATLNIPKISILLDQGNVVVDGLYSWSEYKILKEKYSNQMKVVCIYAPPTLRYLRLTSRTEIDEHLRNRPATESQSSSRDVSEIENIQKGGPIAMADYTIVNDAKKKDFHKEIEQIIDFLIGKKNRLHIRPSWDQYFINITQEVAKRSTCMRGRIGVVIVRDKRIVSTGYNGAPQGLPHCSEVGCKVWITKDDSGNEKENCLRTVHGEANAIAQAAVHGRSTLGATLYGTYKPCSACMKLLINSGIKRVVCEKNYNDTFTDELAKDAKIDLIIYDPNSDSLDTVH